MASPVFRWMLRVSLLVVAIVVLVLAGLSRPVSGQSSAPFATPPPALPPAQIRPYGEFAGCPEEPKRRDPCAMAKAKTFTRPVPGRKARLSGLWGRVVIRNMENIEEHPQTIDGSGREELDRRSAGWPDSVPAVGGGETGRPFSTYFVRPGTASPRVAAHCLWPGTDFGGADPGLCLVLNDYRLHLSHHSHGWPAPPVGRHIHLLSKGMRRAAGRAIRWSWTSPTRRTRARLDHIGNFVQRMRCMSWSA